MSSSSSQSQSDKVESMVPAAADPAEEKNPPRRQSSSSSQSQSDKVESMVPAAPDPAEGKNPPRRQMTQEQIDSLIRYQTVHMPEETFRRLSLETKELLSPEELAYQGNLPVPMGQIDDYIANICRDINKSEARFLRERDRILNDYYTKGYAEEQEPSSPSPAPVPVPVGNANRNPAPGRRRFRPGVVTKSKQAEKATNKMV